MVLQMPFWFLFIQSNSMDDMQMDEGNGNFNNNNCGAWSMNKGNKPNDNASSAFQDVSMDMEGSQNADGNTNSEPQTPRPVDQDSDRCNVMSCRFVCPCYYTKSLTLSGVGSKKLPHHQ